MGVENNEVILATTWNNEIIDSARLWIRTLSDELRNLCVIIPSIVNGKYTIVIGPDGSKKGWPDAKRGKNLRDNFIQFIKAYDYEDGTNPFDWVEVGYGEFGQKVLRGNCVNKYDDSEYYETGGD